MITNDQFIGANHFYHICEQRKLLGSIHTHFIHDLYGVISQWNMNISMRSNVCYGVESGE